MSGFPGGQRRLIFTGSVPSTIGPNPDSLGFGCQAGGTDYFNGYIAEILIYTVNLDLNGVENYLNNKWFNFPIP
jgi:hypothetical protein